MNSIDAIFNGHKKDALMEVETEALRSGTCGNTRTSDTSDIKKIFVKKNNDEKVDINNKKKRE